MLKQKARQLKRITKLTHVEALETVAKISGWQNWRSVKIDNEVDARQLIDEEKRRKEMIGIKKNINDICNKTARTQTAGFNPAVFYNYNYYENYISISIYSNLIYFVLQNS